MWKLIAATRKETEWKSLVLSQRNVIFQEDE
jgi:hypothetical protein